MAEAQLMVRACGPLVSYQDGGRFGRMRLGVPASGPMDRLAHAAANLALGQPPGATAIEISMGGLTLLCVSGAVTCCVAGGGFQLLHAGVRARSWSVRTLRAGDVLSVRAGPWGSWAYLALAGDVQCAQWAGSTATHVSSGLGGGLLQTGAAIQVQDARVCADREGDLPVPAFARLQHGARVVLGPQTAQFMPQATTALLEARFSVTAASDRMGMRLDGPGLVLRDALSIPSEPILHGSIQVGGDGVASILLADHQTTGGYPKIATIVSADLDAVSQLRPGDGLRFQALGAAQAVRVARSHAQARRQYLEAVAMPRGALADRLMRENLISGVVGQGATDADLP
jgi:biotin-dependent carboxylase-like uncharacterized protein